MARRVKSGCIALAVIVLGGFSPALAELKNCNGVWTNRDCSGDSSAAIAESAAKPRDPAAVTAKEKKFWINDLELKMVRAQKEHKIDIDVGDVEVTCEKAETSLEECRRLVADRENSIEKSIMEAKNLALKTKKLEIDKTKAPPQINQVNVFDNNNVVVKKSGKGSRHGKDQASPEPTASPTPKFRGGTQVKFKRDGDIR